MKYYSSTSTSTSAYPLGEDIFGLRIFILIYPQKLTQE